MEKKGTVPDVNTYTSLIHGHCVHGKLDVAVKLFEEMKDKVVGPTVVTCTALISGLSKEGRSDEVFRLYDEMLATGVAPDDSMYSSLMGTCIQLRGKEWIVHRSH